ncbi:MAG: adenylate/guanylate cyclase domain-containing protein [Pseudomonadota bacterium]
MPSRPETMAPQEDARTAALRVPERTHSRLYAAFKSAVERVVSVGIVSRDPDVQRRQRFVNTGACVGGIASIQHVIEQVALDPMALQPLIAHNVVFAIAHLVTPAFHRVSQNAAALWLCFAIIIGTLRVIWLTGLEGGAHVYFAFTAAAFLFFGVAHWRLFVLVLVSAFGAVVAALSMAPKWGPMGLAAPAYIEHLAAMVVINVMVINVWLFTYALVKTHRAETRLADEFVRSDRLLLNIMPSPVAVRLKEAPGRIVADRHENVTIFFADLVGFTSQARNAAPEALVSWLDTLFKTLDELAIANKVEKIKTIGDAYMAVSGLRVEPQVGAERVARFALQFRQAAHAYGGLEGGDLDVRIGLHTGPVVAGVIGGTRFAYDLWGDAVNTASRMESHGAPGRIQISKPTRDLLGPAFKTTTRGRLAVKGLGEVETFWLEGLAGKLEEARPLESDTPTEPPLRRAV